jgi:hypothetical protein
MSPTNAIPARDTVYKISLGGDNQVLTSDGGWLRFETWHNYDRQKWISCYDPKYGLGYKNIGTQKYLSFNDNGWAGEDTGHWTAESPDFTPLPSGGYQMTVTTHSGYRNCAHKYDREFLGCEAKFDNPLPIYLYVIE